MLTLPKPMFVVAIVENNRVTGFYAIDGASGGYPYFPENLGSAEQYDDKAKAIAIAEELNKKSNTPQRPMSDGTLYPHDDIHRALKLNNQKLKGAGQATVFELQMEPVISFSIEGEIKKPTGFTYN